MPNTPDLNNLLNKAFALQKAGDTQQADQVYRQVLGQTSANDLAHADAAYMLGVLASKRQDYAAAIDWIQTAIVSYPQRAIYHFSLAQSLSTIGQNADASKAYEHALKLKPDIKNGRFELAKSYLAQQAYEQATPHLQAVLKAEPQNAAAAFHLGECLQAMHHHPAAIQAFKMALKSNPDQALVWRNLGLSLQKTNKLTEAVTAYSKALKEYPDDARIWLNLGNVYQHRGQLKKTIASYQQGLQRDLNLADLHLNLGVASETLGKLKDARSGFERYLQLQPPRHPESPKVWCHLGRVLRYLDLRARRLCSVTSVRLKCAPRCHRLLMKLGFCFWS